MEINKRQKLQLEFWKSFQEIGRPTVWQFIINQSRFAQVIISLSIPYYILTTCFLAYSGMQTGMFITLFLVFIALYYRFRKDWSLSKNV